MSFYNQDPYGYGTYGQPQYYPPYPAAQYYPPNQYQRKKPRVPKDNAQMWCEICGVGCIGQQSYAEHCNGKKHQLLARKAQPSSAPSDSTTTTTTTTTTPPAVPAASSGSASQRYTPYDSGSPPSSSSSSQEPRSAQGKFYCEICHVYSTDQNTFNLHLTGKKHKIILSKTSGGVSQQPSSADFQSVAVQPPVSNASFINLPRYSIPAAPKSSYTPMLINHQSNLADDNLLNSKIDNLSPTAEHIYPLSKLVQTVTSKLGAFKVPQPEGAEYAPDRPVIMDITMVGPYARGTLIKGFLCADIVVITKDPPNFNMLTVFQTTLEAALPSAKMEGNAEKMDLYVRMPDDVAVHLMLTWAAALDKSDTPTPAPTPTPPPPPDSAIITGVNIPACQRALMMVRQMHFFSDNSLSPNLRPCLKILKDLRNRFHVFSALNNWAIEVIIINALRTIPLSASLSQSLRAIFAFMASGMLLPGVDFIDPCAQESESVLHNLSNRARLDITEASQKILNDMAFGKWEEILGL